MKAHEFTYFTNYIKYKLRFFRIRFCDAVADEEELSAELDNCKAALLEFDDDDTAVIALELDKPVLGDHWEDK